MDVACTCIHTLPSTHTQSHPQSHPPTHTRKHPHNLSLQMLYALALVPMGLLADRLDRPRLLAFGLVMWSVLTVAAAHTNSFGELLATRIGFAIAQV